MVLVYQKTLMNENARNYILQRLLHLLSIFNIIMFHLNPSPLSQSKINYFRPIVVTNGNPKQLDWKLWKNLFNYFSLSTTNNNVFDISNISEGKE